MGGVAGHLAHLYDNRDLTYNKMAEILQKAASGELIGTEKTDGYNIYLGFVDGKARAARNKGDMSRGGMTMEDLSNRVFQGGEKAKKAYVTAFKAYERATLSLTEEERVQIFGPAGEIFYNTEIQGPAAANVVNYDENVLSIHHMGHKKYNRASNQLEVVDAPEQSKILDNVIDRFEQAVADEAFSIRRTAFLELNKITDQTYIENILDRIQSTGYYGDMTIDDYLESKLKPIVDQTFPELEDRIRHDLVERILQKENAPTLTQIHKGLPKEEKTNISQYVEDSKLLIKDLMQGIEEPIHDLAVELLRGLKSAYVLDNPSEVKRLKQETENAIKAIRDYSGPDHEAAQDILIKQLAKLKHHDNIDTVVEGFVFQYDGQMYKFTGNFAPMNQLLGLFKYGRGKIPRMVKEALLERKEANNGKRIIAIYPGRFQPMGKHHAEVFRRIQNEYGEENSFVATSDHVNPPRSPFNFTEKQMIAAAHGIDPSRVIKVKNPYNALEILESYDPVTTAVTYLVGAKDMAEDPRFQRTEGTTKERYDWNIAVAPHVKINIPISGKKLERFEHWRGNTFTTIDLHKNLIKRGRLEHAKKMIDGMKKLDGHYSDEKGREKRNEQWIDDYYPEIADEWNLLVNGGDADLDKILNTLKTEPNIQMCGTTCRKALKDADMEEFEGIMGFSDPEVYDMVKAKLTTEELQEDTQHFLGIFRGLADEVLTEIYIKRKCKKKSKKKGNKTGNCAVVSHKTKKQKACYDNCGEAAAVMHLEEEEIEETSMGGGSVAIGAGGPKRKKRNLEEDEVNEALNYLLQKLGV